jgi:hypothetical protein
MAAYELDLREVQGLFEGVGGFYVSFPRPRIPAREGIPSYPSRRNLYCNSLVYNSVSMYRILGGLLLRK